MRGPILVAWPAGHKARFTRPEPLAMLDLFRQLTRDERRLALALVRVMVDARQDPKLP